MAAVNKKTVRDLKKELRNTKKQLRLAQAFIRAVPFPRASVAKSSEGSEIELRSMRDVAEHEIVHRVAARITLDPKLRITTEQLVWASDLRLR